MLEKDIFENYMQLVRKFTLIKKLGLIKSMRRGYTGIGYTFERLIGKDEDASFYPDYGKIEIKTKLGYSKSAMTLFNLVPSGNNENIIRKIFETYGYICNNKKKIQTEIVFNHNNIVSKSFIFRLKIEKEYRKVRLLIFNLNFNLLDDTIYWNFDDLENRLKCKLNYLALVIGYPYKIEDNIYYRYVKMNLYQLKSFESFIGLLEKGKISILFNVTSAYIDNKIENYSNHGISFRLNIDSIDSLFIKLR